MAPPRPEHPRPQLRRSEWTSLNGKWDFTIDRAESGRERGFPTADSLPGTISVPFPPESERSGVAETDFLNQVWYKRTVDIPAASLEEHLMLHFGAVDYECEVWIDGESVGTHRGGQTPFSFDIADVATPGATTITVCARDDVRSSAQPSGKQSSTYESRSVFYTRVTGIWQPVWLEPRPETYIEQLRFESDLEAGAIDVTATIEGSTSGLTLEGSARLEDEVVASVDRPARSKTKVRLSLEDPQWWSPAEPTLYDLTFSLERGGETIDSLDSYHGMRTLSIEDGRVELNGEALGQRLVLDQGYYPGGLYTAPDDESFRRDIELAQSFGFNGARLHQKVFEPRFLYWADKLGYLVWGEFPDWGLDRKAETALDRFLPEWLEVLERDRNHPSIVGWTPFNETPASQHDRLLSTVYRVTKQVDPTRPVIDASGYHHVETDLIDCHDYTDDVETFEERYNRLGEEGFTFQTSDGAVEEVYGAGCGYVSEYGGTWWDPANPDGWGHGSRPEDATAYLDRIEGLTDALVEADAIWAYCYTQLYDIEQEKNGLATYDREPKFDPERFRDTFGRDLLS